MVDDLIRVNYEEFDAWSFEEAASFAGVSVRTVKNWFYNKEKPIDRGHERGRRVIDAKSFMQYVRGAN